MPGQINRGTELGELIFRLSSQPDINTIVEIGTWNGLGSTQCVLAGLSKKSSFNFISIESSPTMYQEALKNIGIIPNVALILGRIIEPEDIPPLKLSSTQEGWLREDLDNYKRTSNVIDKIPPRMDLLILDGGEFSSEKEFDLIGSRTKYLILDDTNPATGSIKFLNVRPKIMNRQTPFKILIDNLQDRNGWLLAENVGVPPKE